jgi:hypothetical protein
MTSGTVPSPPEASTRGASTGSGPGRALQRRPGGRGKDTRLVGLVLTSVDEALIDRVLFVRPAPGPGGRGEPDPDSAARTQDDGVEQP